jgi:hypothetical protein
MKGTVIAWDFKYTEIIKRKENTKGLNIYHLWMIEHTVCMTVRIKRKEAATTEMPAHGLLK